MALAIDKRNNKFVVVDTNFIPPKERSLRYEDDGTGKGEKKALRYIQLATSFPQDIRFMQVERLYEKPKEEVVIISEPVVTTTEVENDTVASEELPLTYICEECGERFEKPLAKARHMKIHKKEEN